MASWGTFDFSDFSAMAERLENAVEANAVERLTREVLQELANRVLRLTKQKTPVKSGQLRGNWFIGAVMQRGNAFEIEVYNNVSYAPFVENGHRVVINGQDVGWCEGVYMLTLSMREVERIMPQLVGKRTEEFLRKLMEG